MGAELMVLLEVSDRFLKGKNEITELNNNKTNKIFTTNNR